jgi:hypothetical protein
VRRGRIRFRLSLPARVRFTFERRVSRRWWKPTRGTFSHTARAGRTTVRRPALRRGRYRLIAKPRGGRHRTTRFRLRR